MTTTTQHYLDTYRQTTETFLPAAYPEWVTAIDKAPLIVTGDTTELFEDFGSHMVEIYEAVKATLSTAKSDTI